MAISSIPRVTVRGLAAGAVGTVALTVAERVEMAMSGRAASTVPGQVGAKLMGRDPEQEPGLVQRLNPVVHWSHGIGMGAIRGLLGARLGAYAATMAYFPAVWGGDAVLYRALGVAQAPWQWSRSDLVTDLFGKGVLAFATSGAYVLLARRSA